MNEEHQPRLQELVRDVFDDDEIELTPSMTAADIDGWDSLMHINVIVAVEKEFGVRFATAEIAQLKEDGQNIGTFLELIARKLGDE